MHTKERLKKTYGNINVFNANELRTGYESLLLILFLYIFAITMHYLCIKVSILKGASKRLWSYGIQNFEITLFPRFPSPFSATSASDPSPLLPCPQLRVTRALESAAPDPQLCRDQDL